MALKQKIDVEIGPRGSLEILSQREVAALTSSAKERGLLELFRRCALAVLNTGNESDDVVAFFEEHADFAVDVVKRTRGVKLIVRNAPAGAFVEGRMIEGIRQHLFALLRDLVYSGTEIAERARFDPASTDGITDAVFHILKHARVLTPDLPPNLAVCWGGHSISRSEYDYSKEVGYQLGLRGLDICTGCGPGAMKGPMKGAAIGHAKQRRYDARYIGLSEPGIIAAEPPNPMVNQLVVLPDIEKRLEAFLRIGHAFVIFPGGVGTAEELLYLLGVLLDPQNERQRLPVILTGPAESAAYFEELDAFLAATLGERVRDRYQIVMGDAGAVGRRVAEGVRRVRRQRVRDGDAYYFNWLLRVPLAHQTPFKVDHERVAALRLSRDLPVHELAVVLRRAFSAIVTGNVKVHGVRMIQAHGPFELHSDAGLVEKLEHLLRQFVAQGRMTLAGAAYEPCYRVVRI
jgi:predicted Rossmann-fold nucleotide-binding protein